MKQIIKASISAGYIVKAALCIIKESMSVLFKFTQHSIPYHHSSNPERISLHIKDSYSKPTAIRIAESKDTIAAEGDTSSALS